MTFDTKTKIGTGTVVGGVASELTGGKFSQGAFIGGISAAVAFAMKYSSSKPKTGAESLEKGQIDNRELGSNLQIPIKESWIKG